MIAGDTVKLIDIKWLPPEWKLRTGMVGTVAHDGYEKCPNVAFIRFDDHVFGCMPDKPNYPLHVSRLEAL